MEDNIRAAIFFETMFNVLHHYYFPNASFGFLYFSPNKTYFFTDELDFVGFTDDKNEFRSSMKHGDRI